MINRNPHMTSYLFLSLWIVATYSAPLYFATFSSSSCTGLAISSLTSPQYQTDVCTPSGGSSYKYICNSTGVFQAFFQDTACAVPGTN
jgi:hypothetical protein